MQEFWGDIVRAVGFLSRVPMPQRFFAGDSFSLSRVVQAFPLAGFVIALPAAILLAVLLAFEVSPLLAALTALAVSTLVTGALHEDGLADTADGFWGGKTSERILDIMKDSHIGTYGVIALILSFGLRTAALAAIAPVAGGWATALAYLAAETLARTLVVWHWSETSPARVDGVAASAGEPESEATRIALIVGIAIFLILGLISAGLLATLIALASAFGAVAGFTRLAKDKVGGHTGDTLGASEQLSVIAALCAFAIFL